MCKSKGKLNSIFIFQLQIYEDKYLDNIFNYMRFEASKNLGRLRQPVDKTKWSTAPAVLNAFYNPNFNDIGNVI